MNDLDLAPIFAALAGETRLKLLHLLQVKALECSDPERCDLTEKCCNVTELAKELGVSLATTSHHLKELRRAGLIETQRRGQFIYCSLNTEMMGQLARVFEELSV